jgi:hypothetical protein
LVTILLAKRLRVVALLRTGLKVMTAWRQAIELSIGDEDVARLVTITRSRTEPASRVDRARMLLAYREDPSFFAVAHALGVHHQTVQRCVERALAHGPMAALDDRPRTYHGLRRKHIDTYLNEFVFRYNRRFYRHVSFETLLGLATRHEPTGYWDIIKRDNPRKRAGRSHAPRLLHIDRPESTG